MEVLLLLFIGLCFSALVLNYISGGVESRYLRKRLVPKGMVECDLCNEVCDSTGLHFNGKLKRHNLHMLRHHWGEPIIQGKYRKLKAQRDKIAAAKADRALQLSKMRDLEIDYKTIMSVPLGDDFVKELQEKKAIDTLVESLDISTVKEKNVNR